MAWAEPAQVSSKPDFRFQLSSAREVFSLLLHRPWPVKSSSTCGIASVFHRVAYFTGQHSLAREVCICYFTGQYFSVPAFQRRMMLGFLFSAFPISDFDLLISAFPGL